MQHSKQSVYLPGPFRVGFVNIPGRVVGGNVVEGGNEALVVDGALAVVWVLGCAVGVPVGGWVVSGLCVDGKASVVEVLVVTGGLAVVCVLGCAVGVPVGGWVVSGLCVDSEASVVEVLVMTGGWAVVCVLGCAVGIPVGG